MLKMMRLMATALLYRLCVLLPVLSPEKEGTNIKATLLSMGFRRPFLYNINRASGKFREEPQGVNDKFTDKQHFNSHQSYISGLDFEKSLS